MAAPGQPGPRVPGEPGPGRPEEFDPGLLADCLEQQAGPEAEAAARALLDAWGGTAADAAELAALFQRDRDDIAGLRRRHRPPAAPGGTGEETRADHG
jgi:hypothetical protein